MIIAHLELGRHLYGGAEQVRYLLEGLNEDRHQHILLTPEGSALHQWAEAAGQPVVPLRFHGEHDLGLVWRLSRLLRSRSVDLMHVHSRRGADWLGAMAGQAARVPTVISRRVDNPPSKLLVWLMRKQFRRVICISDAIREVLLTAGVDDSTLLTIRSAVAADEFAKAATDNSLNTILGGPHDGPVIGVVAQLIERKGHRFLLERLPALRERFPALKVIFFGRGPLEDKLRSDVVQNNLETCVYFAGFRNDLSEILPALTLVVHPALTEGLGVSLLQVAAAGVPVVAFASGGVKEAIAHEHSGLLVATGDGIALASAIGRLLSDNALRNRMGDNGAMRVRRDFSIDALVQRHAALYDVLAGESS